MKATEKLEKSIADSAKKTGTLTVAEFHRDVIIPDMEALRRISDEIECMVDKIYWAFPTYEEILTSVMY